MIVDSHCHFDFFDVCDWERHWQKARALGVGQLLIPAVKRARWGALLDLRRRFGFLLAYGLHPLFLKAHQMEDIDALRRALQSGEACAVGECGLDFYVPDLDYERQRLFFTAQLDLAEALGLPVIVHARGAGALEEVLLLLSRRNLYFVVHSFTGSDVQLRRLLDLGGVVGIGGTMTYPRAKRLHRQLRFLPNDGYILETDSPDQPLFTYQGQVNTPHRVCEVACALAALRGQSVEMVSAHSTANFFRLFKEL